MKDRRYKILVVDDDLKMCELVSDILSEEGFSVATSGDAAKALKTLREEEFDVMILTDLKMRVKDGFDLLEGAKQMTPETPVILMTAYGSIETAVKAMKMGAAPMVGRKSKGFISQAFKEEFTLHELEKEYIKRVLSETGENKSEASRLLGIDRKTLYRKLKEL